MAWATLTPRGSGLVAGGLISFLIAFYTLHLLLFTIGVIAISFVVAEYLSFCWSTRGFSPGWFGASRFDSPNRVNRKSLGANGMTLSHEGRAAFYAEIWDSYPQTFKVVGGSPHLVTWWAPGESLTIAYAFRPYRRGTYSLGPTVVTAHDAFGLAFKTTTLATGRDLTIVPSVATMPMGNIATRLRTKFLGTTILRRRGYGTEFRSLREYTTSDDFRTIAWKHSTRGKMYVKEFEQEMRQDFLIMLDTSARMGAGRLGEDALDIAVDAATVMTNYVMKREDRIGLLAYSNKEATFLQPQRGARNIFDMMRIMAVVNTTNAEFDLESSLAYLTKNLKDRTHVFAFATASPPTTKLVHTYAKFVAKGHKIYLFTPETFVMYPPYDDFVAERTVALAQSVDLYRSRETVRALRGLGIPVVTYDSRGATTKVLSLYSMLKTWGWAK